MKITQEHMWKKVRSSVETGDASVEVVYVGDWSFAGKYLNGCLSLFRLEGWELAEEPFLINGIQVKIGDKIRSIFWDPKKFIIVSKWDSDYVYSNLGEIDCYNGGISRKWLRDEHEFEFYEEPKLKKLVAPALCVYDGCYAPSGEFFADESRAREMCRSFFVKWPAIPNKDGFYEV